MEHAIEVAENPDAERYEITLDGRLAGFADYRRRAGRLVLTHTEVSGGFEGKGLGSRLVRGALDSARSEGVAVVALCSFVARFIERHPEYGALLAESDDQPESAGAG